jgi:hypothetical protein
MSKEISKRNNKNLRKPKEIISVQDNSLATEFQIGELKISISFSQSNKRKGTYKNKS